jgi:hypothetical protein
MMPCVLNDLSDRALAGDGFCASGSACIVPIVSITKTLDHITSSGISYRIVDRDNFTMIC